MAPDPERREGGAQGRLGDDAHPNGHRFCRLLDVQYRSNPLGDAHSSEPEDASKHHQQHHRHQYDPFGPTPDVYNVRLITNGDWPVLSEVIQEADGWYWDNVETLGALLQRLR